MNACVTGGGGFLGSRIVEMLVERGDSVRVLGRHRYSNLADIGVDCVVGDLRDAEAVCAACAGAEAVYHVAALTDMWGDKRDFFEVNVKGTANVIHGCLTNKVCALVYTSTPSVAIGDAGVEHGDERLPYLRHYLAHYPASKAVAEKMVLEANGWEMACDDLPPPAQERATRDIAVPVLRTCALRPHLIWGPRDRHLIPRVLEMARAGRLVRVGDGSNKVDITYIDNAARAHLQAADELLGEGRAAGNAYFLGDREPVVLWDWISNLLERAGEPPVSKSVSYKSARRLAAILEVLHRLIPRLGEPRLTRFVVTQLAQSHYFSHAKAGNDFGYEPIVDSETGMMRLLDWLKSERSEA